MKHGLRTLFRTTLTLFAGALIAGSTHAAGPDIEHWLTDKGARVYFVASDALPMLDVRIDFDAGHARDPVGQAGLASLVAQLLDTGADGLDQQEIAETAADAGARLSNGTENDRAWFALRTLSSAAERDATVALAARILARPDFPAAAFERDHRRVQASLRESLTRPATLASRGFSSSVFADHPYGRLATVDTLRAITRDDLAAFHARHYTASNAAISIVGDVSRAEAERIADALTRNLATGSALPPLDDPADPTASEQRFPHPSTQAHILAGLPGMTRDDADYFPLLVGNHVLGGGGFVSRLVREVRDARGLAYSVYSLLNPQRVRGPFRIGLQTRGSQADDALEVVRDVLADFIAHGPTEEEVEAAQNNLIHGFGLRLDSNAKILEYVALIGFYDLPLDWLERYPEQVAEVTVEDVHDAFVRRINPDHLVVVIAGGDSDPSPEP